MAAWSPSARTVICTSASATAAAPAIPATGRRTADELSGKILRLDVDGAEPYAIPADNPFAAGRRAARDLRAGPAQPLALLVRPRGRAAAAPATSARTGSRRSTVVSRGGNYGWRLMEGKSLLRPGQRLRAAWARAADRSSTSTDQGRCSITGGYVYRGLPCPGLPAPTSSATSAAARSSACARARSRCCSRLACELASFGEDARRRTLRRRSGRRPVPDHRRRPLITGPAFGCHPLRGRSA